MKGVYPGRIYRAHLRREEAMIASISQKVEQERAEALRKQFILIPGGRKAAVPAIPRPALKVVVH